MQQQMPVLQALYLLYHLCHTVWHRECCHDSDLMSHNRHFLEGISFEVITDHKNIGMLAHNVRFNKVAGMMGFVSKLIHFYNHI